MKILLLNKHPVISKLVRLSAQKLEYEFEEQGHYADTLALADVIVVDDSVSADLKDLQNKCKKLICISSAATNTQANPKILHKPFLPTDLIALMKDEDKPAASASDEEEAQETPADDAPLDLDSLSFDMPEENLQTSEPANAEPSKEADDTNIYLQDISNESPTQESLNNDENLNSDGLNAADTADLSSQIPADVQNASPFDNADLNALDSADLGGASEKATQDTLNSSDLNASDMNLGDLNLDFMSAGAPENGANASENSTEMPNLDETAGDNVAETPNENVVESSAAEPEEPKDEFSIEPIEFVETPLPTLESATNSAEISAQSDENVAENSANETALEQTTETMPNLEPANDTEQSDNATNAADDDILAQLKNAPDEELAFDSKDIADIMGLDEKDTDAQGDNVNESAANLQQSNADESANEQEIQSANESAETNLSIDENLNADESAQEIQSVSESADESANSSENSLDLSKADFLQPLNAEILAENADETAQNQSADESAVAENVENLAQSNAQESAEQDIENLNLAQNDAESAEISLQEQEKAKNSASQEPNEQELQSGANLDESALEQGIENVDLAQSADENLDAEPSTNESEPERADNLAEPSEQKAEIAAEQELNANADESEIQSTDENANENSSESADESEIQSTDENANENSSESADESEIQSTDENANENSSESADESEIQSAQEFQNADESANESESVNSSESANADESVDENSADTNADESKLEIQSADESESAKSNDNPLDLDLSNADFLQPLSEPFSIEEKQEGKISFDDLPEDAQFLGQKDEESTQIQEIRPILVDEPKAQSTQDMVKEQLAALSAMDNEPEIDESENESNANTEILADLQGLSEKDLQIALGEVAQDEPNANLTQPNADESQTQPNASEPKADTNAANSSPSEVIDELSKGISGAITSSIKDDALKAALKGMNMHIDINIKFDEDKA